MTTRACDCVMITATLCESSSDVRIQILELGPGTAHRIGSDSPCNRITHTDIHTQHTSHTLHTNTRTHTHTHTHTHIRSHTHVHILTLHAHTHTYTHICIKICIYDPPNTVNTHNTDAITVKHDRMYGPRSAYQNSFKPM